jgi:hypothetical protein
MKQKIINLFNSLEEKYFFPMGRRTWQGLSFLGLAAIIVGLLYFFLNATPTFRDDVEVEKEEVIEDQAIEEEYVEEISSNCDREDYEEELNKLKLILSNCEFNDLGDSIERTKFVPLELPGTDEDTEDNDVEVAVEETASYFSQSEFDSIKALYSSKDLYRNYWGGINEKVSYKEFRPNMKAIPNQLNNLYDQKGIDSAEFCKKINIVKAVNSYVKQFDFNYFNQYKIYRECYQGFLYYDFSNKSITWAKAVMPIVVVDFDGIIAVNEQHRQFKRIHNMAIKNYISEDVVELAESTIEEHQELEEPESDLNYRDYLSVISTIDSYSSSMGDDIESAVDDFNDDIDYFDQNNFLRSLDRYLELYLQRVSDAESDKIARSAEKAEKRVFSGMLMAAGFALILLIGIILLLFSIQNILKKNIDK